MQSIEMDKKTLQSINETEKKELLEIVKKQQQEIDQLKNRLDLITVNSSNVNDYVQIK